MPLLGGEREVDGSSSNGLVAGSSLAHDNGNCWLSDAPSQSGSVRSVAMGDEGGASYGGERLIGVELRLARGPGLGLDFFERAISNFEGYKSRKSSVLILSFVRAAIAIMESGLQWVCGQVSGPFPE